MGYKIVMYTDGGCRRNGYSNAIGAAAAVHENRWGKSWYRTRRLTSGTVTSQRAELTAIILALEWAQEKLGALDGYTELDCKIYSDSRYAVNCMTRWIYKWEDNGWLNSRNDEVANRDLIEEAADLKDDLERNGKVTFQWVPRSETCRADTRCNEVLDEMEDEGW